jgi:hypothetical protein
MGSLCSYHQIQFSFRGRNEEGKVIRNWRRKMQVEVLERGKKFRNVDIGTKIQNNTEKSNR